MAQCYTCNTPLDSEEVLKDHYKSQLHQINLKRRVVDMPPVSAESLERHLAAEAERKAKEEKESAACVYICDACHKTFGSEGMFETHIRTKKHVARVKELLAARKAGAVDAAAGAGSGSAEKPAEVTGSDGTVPTIGGGASESKGAEPGDDHEEAAADGEKVMTVSALHCLFCFQVSEDVASNLAHMRAEHSFFVPDVRFLTDPEGLVEHLMSKVVEGRCLFCKGHSAFVSPQAAQQHMVAKAHCKFAYETEEQFEEYSEFYDYAEDSDDEEDDEDAEAAAAAKGHVVVSGACNDVTLTATGDLVLPDGRIAHPRQLMRYYKQRFTGENPVLAAQLQRLALDYAASGVLSAGTSLTQLRAMAALRTGTRGNLTDKIDQRHEAAYLRRMELHTGMQMNQIRRKYFRVQLLQ